jgi:hypothetical protein
MIGSLSPAVISLSKTAVELKKPAIAEQFKFKKIIRKMSLQPKIDSLPPKQAGQRKEEHPPGCPLYYLSQLHKPFNTLIKTD